MKREDYQQPQVTALDMEGYELMQDFIIFSTTEVIPGPIVDPDPDDGVGTGEALVKGFSVWDEE
ncbi:MAG: hypothetical protein IJK42_04660 [Prevotella sp.]|nr:hypothetical protein [Prevotella sp.]MBQ6209048.1 hypothetical protein [Prevotella sp.]